MYKIIKRLCNHKYKVHFVGGAVRDILLGEEPKDCDIVTNATTDQIVELFKDCNVDLVGANFQVVIVNGIEVASYRIDNYNKNELISVSTATTLEEDLSRRDLTINSMAMCPISGDIIDLFNGRKHLQNKLISFVGNPEDRIKEDPCRILRACRFASKIEGSFDYKTVLALKNYQYKIKDISPERIRIEILKSMEYKKSSYFFGSLFYIDGLKYIFPSLNECDGQEGGKYHKEDVLTHCMIAGDSIHPKFPLLKLAIYLHDIGKNLTAALDEEGNTTFHGHEDEGEKIAREELTNLKFSNDEVNYICNIIRLHMRSVKDLSPKAMRKLIVELNKSGISYKDLIRVRIADRKGNLAKENQTFAEIRHMVKKFKDELNKPEKVVFDIKSLKIDGNDVMNILGIGPGKRVGEVLKNLFELVLDNLELNTREELENIVKEYGV